MNEDMKNLDHMMNPSILQEESSLPKV